MIDKLLQTMSQSISIIEKKNYDLSKIKLLLEIAIAECVYNINQKLHEGRFVCS